jgi:hypothetical protein
MFKYLFIIFIVCFANSFLLAQEVSYEKNVNHITLTSKEPPTGHIKSWFVTNKTNSFTIIFTKKNRYLFKANGLSNAIAFKFIFCEKNNNNKIFEEVIDGKSTKNIVITSQTTQAYRVQIDNFSNQPIEIMLFYLH